MNICLVTRASGENNYILEYCNYYLSLGVDKIYLINNNIDELYPELIINNKLINIIYCDKHELLNYYKNTLKKCLTLYDFILSFDVDEFLVLKKHNNIKEYLSESFAQNNVSLLINWLCYSDNNELVYNNKPVIERFTIPCTGIFAEEENKGYKSIYNCKKILELYEIGDIVFYEHGFYLNKKYDSTINYNGYYLHNILVYNNGDIVDFNKQLINKYNIFANSLLYLTYNHNEEYAVLNHYVTKTLEEYIIKSKKNKPIFNNNFRDNLNYYITINNYTDTKNINKIKELWS